MYFFESSDEIKQAIANGKLVVSAVKCTEKNDYYPRNLTLFLLNLETAKTAKVVAYAPDVVGEEDFELNGAIVKELAIWKTFKNNMYTPDVVVVKAITLEQNDEIAVIDGINVERGNKSNTKKSEPEKKSEKDNPKEEPPIEENGNPEKNSEVVNNED